MSKTAQEATLEKGSQPSKPGLSFKKKLLIGLAAFLVLAIGLGVGLGVGLTVGKNNGDDDSSSSPPKGASTDGEDSSELKRKAAWKPKAGEPWHIQLIKTLNVNTDLIPNVSIYDIDMFDNSKKTFAALHDEGYKIICYFSAGSYEEWRDDADEFEQDDLGSNLDGWPGEKWLKLDSTNVRNIMSKRIAYAADKGCDAIDPDNVDGYNNENGLGLTEQDSISFVQFLAEEARKYKLAIGLKNAGDIIPDVLSVMDFSVNEQCVQYEECEDFKPFIDDDKPVFNIEYPDAEESPWSSWDEAKEEICSTEGRAEGTEDFSHVIKNMDLDRKVWYCNGKTYS